MATSRVSVKIPTQRLIDALGESKNKFQQKIEELDAQQETAVQNETARKEAAKAYATDPKNAGNITVGNIYIQGDQATVYLTVEVPQKVLPELVTFDGYLARELRREALLAIEAIENSIRILGLTDDEYVSTSTYNSVAKYL